MDTIEMTQPSKGLVKPAIRDPEAETMKPMDEIVMAKNGLVLVPQPVVGDALDPLNWSFLRKHTILAIVMALYFMFTYITGTTVPSFPMLQEKYSVNLAQITWSVATPALGLALGPLIWASPADIFGRRLIFILGTVIALGSTIGAALAPNYSGYMAARFFQGFGVSPASNVGLSIISDIFFEHERGQKIGLWVMAIDLGLLFGPLIGSFVTLAGHQWIQWLSAILFGIILVLELLFLPETLYPRDAMATASRDENKTAPSAPSHTFGNVPRTQKLRFFNVAPVPEVSHPKLHDPFTRFLATFKMLVVSISVIIYCFGWYLWVLSVVTLIPVAYSTYEVQTQGLLYIGLIVGTVVSEIFFSGTLSDYMVIKLAKRRESIDSPEVRLWLVYPAAVITAIGLLVWGISVDRNYHWAVGQVALALFAAGIQMGNTAVCAYIVDAYPLQSMSTMTFYAVMLNMSAVVDPFFIMPWVENVGFTWTFAGHALITAFCIPVIGLLHWYGASLREKGGKPAWGQSGA